MLRDNCTKDRIAFLLPKFSVVRGLVHQKTSRGWFLGFYNQERKLELYTTSLIFHKTILGELLRF
jgi:hypothetical protein